MTGRTALLLVACAMFLLLTPRTATPKAASPVAAMRRAVRWIGKPRVFLGPLLAALVVTSFAYGWARTASANHTTAANEITVASTAANTTIPLATNFNVTLAVTTSTAAYKFIQWELAYSSNISFVGAVYTCAQLPGEVETATVEAPAPFFVSFVDRPG